MIIEELGFYEVVFDITLYQDSFPEFIKAGEILEVIRIGDTQIAVRGFSEPLHKDLPVKKVTPEFRYKETMLGFMVSRAVKVKKRIGRTWYGKPKYIDTVQYQMVDSKGYPARMHLGIGISTFPHAPFKTEKETLEFIKKIGTCAESEYKYIK